MTWLDSGDRFVIDSVSDEEILTLYDIFFTPGYHIVSFPSAAVARVLVSSFLSSIREYSSVVPLALSIDYLPEYICDGLVFGSSEEFCIDSFLLEDFYYNFCWAESSAELMRSRSFRHFLGRLYDFNLIGSVSLTMLEYSS